MVVSEYVTKDEKEKLFREDGKGISAYNVYLKCDECGKEWQAKFVNWKKSRERHPNIDYCSSCSRKGEKNSQYGKDRKDLCEYARSHVKNHAREFSKETREKMSRIKCEQIVNGEFDIKSNNRGNKAWYHSIKNNEDFYADSSLELMRMEQLDEDDSVLKWTKRHGYIVPYEFEGVVHNYVPDFLITYKDGSLVMEELKGYVKPVELIKKKAGEEFFKNSDIEYKFITQKEMNINGEYRAFLKKIGRD